MGSNGADIATQRAYDAVAEIYAQMLPDMRVEAPLDRAVLAAFVEMLDPQADALVAEVGCGSGRVTAHLMEAGLRMVGFDLSHGMVAAASVLHPQLPFAVAHAAALPLRADALEGLVSWYSLIHLPTRALPNVFSEFARVMRPRAPLVVAFQCGDGERVERTSAYGPPVSMTYYRHPVEDLAQALVGSGFMLHATMRREASLTHETTAQGFVVARHRDVV